MTIVTISVHVIRMADVLFAPGLGQPFVDAVKSVPQAVLGNVIRKLLLVQISVMCDGAGARHVTVGSGKQPLGFNSCATQLIHL